ncbi:MAG: SAM-dependent methyltransferase [Akkermansiaceae bacterium]
MQQLIRISEVFAPMHEEILERMGIVRAKRMGVEYWLFSADELLDVESSRAGLWIRWRMRVDHAWPCVPEKTEDFLEKATTALVRKFATRPLQQIMVSPLVAGSPHPVYKKMAAQLQVRLRVEFSPPAASRDPEQQDPHGLTMFVLLGKEGLFATVASPRECRGFYAGGSKFISHKAAHSISRAGAKVAEALHLLRLYRDPLPDAAHWLELGASPGGMTAELLERGYVVTAVDRAPMDARVAGHPRLRFYTENAQAFQPPRGEKYDALLCDMNGSAEESLAVVLGKIPYLKSGALVIFTMKAHKAATVAEILDLDQRVMAQARNGGLTRLARWHLTYNRHEFTFCWELD